MNLEIRKFKSTPIKLVTFNNKVIGAFYNGGYVNREGFDEELRRFCELEGPKDVLTVHLRAS